MKKIRFLKLIAPCDTLFLRAYINDVTWVRGMPKSCVRTAVLGDMMHSGDDWRRLRRDVVDGSHRWRVGCDMVDGAPRWAVHVGVVDGSCDRRTVVGTVYSGSYLARQESLVGPGWVPATLPSTSTATTPEFPAVATASLPAVMFFLDAAGERDLDANF